MPTEPTLDRASISPAGRYDALHAGRVSDVAFGAGSLWVANGRRLPNAQFVGPVAIAEVGDPARFRARLEAELATLPENHHKLVDAQTREGRK